MMDKYYSSVLPQWPELPQGCSIAEQSLKLRQKVSGLPPKLDAMMNQLAFSEALSAIWEIISEANRFIELSAPWTLSKEKKDNELKCVMLTIAEVLQKTALLVWPFMPSTAENIWRQLGFKNSIELSFLAAPKTMAGATISKGESLFPRIDTKK
jgi:methionyl-tRNA synthetase